MRQPAASAMFVLALAVGGAASAQQSTTSSSQRPKSARPASLTLKGCVAEASGHYLLNRAMPANPPVTPGPAGAPAKSDDETYELIGPGVKAHVGHQVEVTGTPTAEDSNSGGTEPNDLKRTAHPMAGTVNVKSVKMLAATCP